MFVLGLVLSGPLLAEIPYKVRDGIEEVDYAKLNLVEG
jgi:hypothetical protein